jgi:hypothetical protein
MMNDSTEMAQVVARARRKRRTMKEIMRRPHRDCCTLLCASRSCLSP